MHFGKLQDEDWYVEENFTLVEATMEERKICAQTWFMWCCS